LSQKEIQESRIQSRVFRLIKPMEIVETVVEHDVHAWEVVVEPLIGSICHADLRYFKGHRRAEALQRKLPMALIHEGIAKVVHSPSALLQRDQRVVVVPNIPGYLHNGISPEQCCPSCRDGKGDNYCHYGRFLGSGVDGMAQQRLVLPESCVVPIPDEVPDEIAVLTELCTVSYQALTHVKEKLKDANVAVFGDGPVGYLAAAMLYHVYGVSRERLHVFGADAAKLRQFDFATCNLVQEYDFSSDAGHDIAVECTGGKFSESAVNQAIDVLNPGGFLILMGVTEDRVPINTRDVLEKGITLLGSSRSSVSDYPPVIQAMKDSACQQTLRKLLPDESKEIETAEDFAHVMEEASLHRGWKKVLLHFRW
jgi:ribitol-5-phosphate 2-dehydrogenase